MLKSLNNLFVSLFRMLDVFPLATANFAFFCKECGLLTANL